jgi:hypothetical protein
MTAFYMFRLIEDTPARRPRTRVWTSILGP